MHQTSPDQKTGKRQGMSGAGDSVIRVKQLQIIVVCPDRDQT